MLTTNREVIFYTHTNEGDKEMNKSAITKTLNEVEKLTAQYSLGFARIHALPKRVRNNLNLASLLNGVGTKDAHHQQKDFLESLSESEFLNWLKIA